VWCGFDFICFGFKIYFENGFENKKNMKINNMNNSPFFLFGLVARWPALPPAWACPPQACSPSLRRI
jgi:hypothetical protein